MGAPDFCSNALPNALRIGPTFGVIARNLLVQISDGRRWLIELETGRIAPTKESGNRTSKVWWSQSPGELEANTVPIPDGAGLVRMVDLASGIERWRHQIEGESSLSGDPPQIAAWGDTIAPRRATQSRRRTRPVGSPRRAIAVDGRPSVSRRGSNGSFTCRCGCRAHHRPSGRFTRRGFTRIGR